MWNHIFKQIFEEPFGKMNPKGESFKYHINYLIMMEKRELFLTYNSYNYTFNGVFIERVKVEWFKFGNCGVLSLV